MRQMTGDKVEEALASFRPAAAVAAAVDVGTWVGLVDIASPGAGEWLLGMAEERRVTVIDVF